MIRRARSEDIEEINVLGEQLHPNFTNLYHLETEIDSNLSIILVSIEKGVINGYLCGIDFGDNIDLLSIFVDKMERSRGIGTKLLKRLIQYAKDESITLEVSEDNIKALGLYHKMGFKSVGLREKYYKNSNAIIMKKGG